MRPRLAAASHSWQLAGAAAALAVLSCVTLVSHSRRPISAELAMRVPNSPKLLWLGDNGYIDGLEDDGQFMVPSTPADESSGWHRYRYISIDIPVKTGNIHIYPEYMTMSLSFCPKL